MSQYLESIQRFDENAKQETIDNIVNHLGIALKTADGQTVAATDDKELAAIRDGFCAKKLGLSAEEADKLIKETCEDMQYDTAKCRVTFYYLLAHKAGKLEQFA